MFPRNIRLCPNYEGRSESNPTYVMLAHDVGDGCWRYSSRGCTFRPIFASFVAMRQIAEEEPVRMASGAEVRTKQRRVTKFLHVGKLHPLTLIDAC
jgi:hypothetical protein